MYNCSVPGRAAFGFTFTMTFRIKLRHAPGIFSAADPAAENRITEGRITKMKVIKDSVDTGDKEIAYARFGEGEKIFVIIPGLSIKSVIISAESVAKAYSAFSDGYTVYLFDRRTNIPDNYTIRGIAEDTAQAMDALGIKAADVFGVSQGGMAALCLAAYRQELVSSLVVGSTVHDTGYINKEIVENWLSLAHEKKYKELNILVAESIYSDSLFKANKEVFGAFASSISDSDAERFIKLADITQGYETEDMLSRIVCPSLVIAAGNDKIIPLSAQKKLAEALGSELYVYEGFGHAVYDEAPDYKERILSFLRSKK